MKRRILVGWSTGSILLAVMIAAALGVFAAETGSVYAQTQDDCADPLKDLIFFDISFWEKTDFCQHNVSYREIRNGGVPPNGIRPIYDPAFESVESASAWLVEQSPVIAVQIGDEAKAYPMSIMLWHEIVNDELGGIPIAVTLCPLCNASITFDRRVGEDVLAFGTTGNLRKSDLIMWDDLTQSWWQQFTGEGIVGAYTGVLLDMLPSQVIGFGDFATQFPDGLVLSLPDYPRDYGVTPYPGYDTTVRPLLSSEAEFDALDDRLSPSERVLGGIIGGVPVAYPFSVLVDEIVVNDTVGGEAVAAFWQPGVASPLDLQQVDESRDIGTAALYSRVLDGQTLTFSPDADGTIRDEQTGSVWNAFGTALEGTLAGSQLRRYVSNGHFWFAWSSFRPDTLVYGVN